MPALLKLGFFLLAIAYCPSIYLSLHLSIHVSETLEDQDHIGGKSWKIIAPTISPTPFFLAQMLSAYFQ